MTDILVQRKPGPTLKCWVIPNIRGHLTGLTPPWLPDLAWHFYKGWFVVENTSHDMGYELFTPDRFYETYDLVTGPTGSP